MANPLYQMMHGNRGNDLLSRFNQFRQNFKGDPNETIQQMLKSGRITQAQYNQAVQMAQQFQRMFNR